MNDMQKRPEFPDPQAYVDDCCRQIGNHEYPWPAASRDELIAVVLALPDFSHLFWPCSDQRARWDLPNTPQELREELTEPDKDRLLWSLVEDEQFRDAVGHLVSGGAVNE